MFKESTRQLLRMYAGDPNDGGFSEIFADARMKSANADEIHPYGG